MATNIFSIGTQHLQAFDLRVSDFGSVYQMLSTLKEHYPVKILRKLRRDVYRLAYEAKPSGQIAVAEMDDDTDLDKVEIVIGVGKIKELAAVGYSAMGRLKLIEYMLAGEMGHDGEGLMDVAIPRIFRGVTYAPIYYPMFIAGRLNDAGEPLAPLGNCPNGQRILEGITELKNYLIRDREAYRAKSFEDLLAEGSRVAAGYGLECKYELDDVVALRELLQGNTPDSLKPAETYWTLACKYDALVFGPDFEGDRAKLHAALGITVAKPIEELPELIEAKLAVPASTAD
jgi:hypothetical protein